MCVAAPIDTDLLGHWEKHLHLLEQAGVLTVWSERHLSPGTNQMEQLTAHLDQADGIILLLSADFFADPTCYILMQRGLRRHQEGSARLIPLLVRPVSWRDSALGTLACLPANGVPLITWKYPDEGWLSAVQGMQRMFRLMTHPSSSLPPASKHTLTDRERMLRLLRRTYHNSLEGSLQGIVWMEVGLAEHPDQVRNATHLLQRLPDQTERVLPVETSILSAYEQAEEQLLILGAPGAGKSILLLDLAQRLVERAEEDETHPLPVIVPLSSWASSRVSLADWLVEQLARIYDVPRQLSQAWVQQRHILPLLDGLDEMEIAARIPCIVAINTYRREWLAQMVVCSRRDEYEAASVAHHLVLQNAVVIQPLSQKQVTDVIQACGPSVKELEKVLTEHSVLRELATTPLMLSVLILAYRNTTISNLPQQNAHLEDRIWADYVKRMVRQKGAERTRTGQDTSVKHYSLEQTYSWLGWLAQQMRAHNQTLFYGEYLQESWIPTRQRGVGTWLLVRLPTMLLGALTSLLLSIFLFSPDPTLLYQTGLIGGFLGWWISEDYQREITISPLQRSQWKRLYQKSLPRLPSAVLLGSLVAACYCLNVDRSYEAGWFQGGVSITIILSMSGLLLQSRLARIARLPDRLSLRPTNGWLRLFRWMQTVPGRRAIWTGVIVGIGIYLSFIVSVELGTILDNTPMQMNDVLMSNALSVLQSSILGDGLHNGLVCGMSVGGATYFISIIQKMQNGTIRLAERIHWTGKTFVQIRHLQTSLLVTLGSFCWLGLSLIEGPELSLGLNYVLNYFLIQGLSIGLSYWLLIGLYQGLTQEHLEDQKRRQFNQGIHRSLRNSACFSLLSAVIITLIYGVNNGLSNGLNNTLSNWLYMSGDLLSNELNNVLSYMWSYELSMGWLILLCGWLVVWLATGGLTILRHYLLRLLLARSRTFPWQAQAFLDDATARVLLRQIGGGYSFVHRRLLDYFAARPALPDELSTKIELSSPYIFEKR